MFDRNLLSEHFSFSYIIRRSKFQTKILKTEIYNNYCRNIIYMHWVPLPKETRLQYSTFCYLIEETNFSLFCNIFTNATLEFGCRCFFNDMSFYGHEFFKTVLDSLGLISYLIVRIINDKIIFLLYFPLPSSFLMALRSSLFEIFRKLQ